jgi:hypothetical protein
MEVAPMKLVIDWVWNGPWWAPVLGTLKAGGRRG